MESDSVLAQRTQRQAVRRKMLALIVGETKDGRRGVQNFEHGVGNKKPRHLSIDGACCFYCLTLQTRGAQEGTRTPTVLPPLGPEPSASTNFATWAFATKARF